MCKGHVGREARSLYVHDACGGCTVAFFSWPTSVAHDYMGRFGPRMAVQACMTKA
jgi:hypothetical protein